jgi:hypothetical protein
MSVPIARRGPVPAANPTATGGTRSANTVTGGAR